MGGSVVFRGIQNNVMFLNWLNIVSSEVNIEDPWVEQYGDFPFECPEMTDRKYRKPHEGSPRVEVFDLEEEEDLPEEAQVRQELGKHSPRHVTDLTLTALHKIGRDVPSYC